MGNTQTAATLPNDISAPRFSIVTKAIGGLTDGDGRRRFRATASSTITDRAGDEISLKALGQMAEKFRRGVTIFTDHENKVANAFGTTDTAEIVQRGNDPKTGAAIWDLDIAGVVNEPNPNAVQLHDSIAGGYVQLGCSIDAFVLDHTRKKSGGLMIDGLDVFAASIVGVPMNQRSWTQKAVRAIKGFQNGEQLVDDAEDDEETVEKAELSSHERSDLPDSAFACPKKRKYPIRDANGKLDAAHVRNALARIADPSNDQCGKSKILAAARELGIGEHGKELDLESIEEPVIEKAAGTENTDALDRQDIMHEAACADCGHAAGCDCADCPCTNEAHDESDTDDDGDSADDDTDFDGKSLDESDAIIKGTTTGGQEAGPATPETAPDAAGDGADTAAVRKALAFDAADVVDLVEHTRMLVKALSESNDLVVTLRKELNTANEERDRLASENAEAREVIEKMMRMPLRAKTVGIVSDFSRRLPDFLAPEVKDFLGKLPQE